MFTRYLLAPCGASGDSLVDQEDSLRTPGTTSNYPTTGLIITVLIGRAPVDTRELSSWDHLTKLCPLSLVTFQVIEGLQFFALSGPMVSTLRKQPDCLYDISQCFTALV